MIHLRPRRLIEAAILSRWRDSIDFIEIISHRARPLRPQAAGTGTAGENRQ